MYPEASTHGTDREDYIKITAGALSNAPSGPLTLKMYGILTWESTDY